MEKETKGNFVNGIDLNVLNGTVSAVKKDPELGKCIFRARNKWIGANHNCTTIFDYYGAKKEMTHKQKFELHADEPPILAGQDQGANPAEHLLNALAACVTTSMIAHAAVQGIHIEELESVIEGDLDLNGFLGLNPDISKGFTDIRMKFTVKTDAGNLDLLKKLSEFSPIYNTITRGARVEIDVKQK